MKYICSSSVQNFDWKIKKFWKLDTYVWRRDSFSPVLFFGMYHIGDYYHFVRHRGKRYVFWCGSDIDNLYKTTILGRKIRKLVGRKVESRLSLIPLLIFQIFKAEHYCENHVEQTLLAAKGIYARVRPSFLGNPNDFPISFTPESKPHVWFCSHPGSEELYGLTLLEKVAPKVPEVTFHIYGGVDAAFPRRELPNVIYHGKVPETQFNEEISTYQAGLRLNQLDGVSEVMLKSLFMGQWPITTIQYDCIDWAKDEKTLIELLKGLKNKKRPNTIARAFWVNNINIFPWLTRS